MNPKDLATLRNYTPDDLARLLVITRESGVVLKGIIDDMDGR